MPEVLRGRSIAEKFNLSGRTAIITGVGPGIGAHVAAAFAGAGAKVVCSARSSGVITETAAGIRASGGEALALTADILEADARVALVNQAREAFGPIHILFNNATAGAIAPEAGIWGNTPDVWDKALGANITAIFHLAELVHPDMEAHQSGSIITVGSSGGFSVIGNSIAYSVAKAGTAMLTRYLAKAMAPATRVNMISVGAITPDGGDSETLKTYSQLDLTGRNAIQRFGHADEVVGAALLLASAASSYTTGSTIFVDGGRIGTMG
jgi:NAD(P)-dependent dehydrogenase (short-subunit alcohol dehydrogenase family)